MPQNFISVQMNGSIVTTMGTATPTTQVKQVKNIFHYYRQAGTSSPSTTAIKTVFMSTVGTPLLALLNQSYTLNSLAIRILDNAPQLTPADLFTIGTSGGLDGTQQDAALSVRIKYPTIAYHKGSIAGKKFSGIDESHVTPDGLNDVGFAAWQGFAPALVASLTEVNTPNNTWVPVTINHGPNGVNVSTYPASITIGTNAFYVKQGSFWVVERTFVQTKRRRAQGVFA